jgi:hypothetical protein
VGAGKTLSNEARVFGEDGSGEGIPNPIQEFSLRTFYHGRIREEEFLVCEGVVNILPHVNYGRQEPRAPSFLD